MLSADPLDAIDLMNAETPVLSASSPLLTAQEIVRRSHTRDGYRTLQHLQSTFYSWLGTHYAALPLELIRARIWAFLGEAVTKSKAGELLPFAPNKHKVANVIEALAAVTQMPARTAAPVWLDHEEHPPAAELLSVSNGLLHLPTRTLLNHTAAFFGINAVSYPYDPDAMDPAEWLNFLKSVWPDDQRSIDTLQELFGLLLTPDTAHQKAFLIVGPARSGKGTIARVVNALLGAKNVAGPTLNGLTQNFGLAPLIGKPLAIISDARLSGRADAHVIAERILSITGEDVLTIDRKHVPPWTGRLPTRLLILTNEIPKLTDTSGALASRFIVLRLTRSFYGREDQALTYRLLEDLSGILKWAMEGRDRLAKRGHFVQPASAKQAIDDLADLASPVGAFVRERCVVGANYSEECSQMFDSWITWCGDTGRDHPGTTQVFSRDLAAVLPNVRTDQMRVSGTSKRMRFYCGVALK